MTAWFEGAQVVCKGVYLGGICVDSPSQKKMMFNYVFVSHLHSFSEDKSGLRLFFENHNKFFNSTHGSSMLPGFAAFQNSKTAYSSQTTGESVGFEWL